MRASKSGHTFFRPKVTSKFYFCVRISFHFVRQERAIGWKKCRSRLSIRLEKMSNIVEKSIRMKTDCRSGWKKCWYQVEKSIYGTLRLSLGDSDFQKDFSNDRQSSSSILFPTVFRQYGTTLFSILDRHFFQPIGSASNHHRRPFTERYH